MTTDMTDDAQDPAGAALGAFHPGDAHDAAGAAADGRSLHAGAAGDPDDAGTTDAALDLRGTDIAVVGMAGRFPGADDVAGLWQTIRAGRSGLTRFTDAELRAAGVPEQRLADPDFVPVGAVVDGIDRFDAAFFGFNPKEAQILDPQHRLFLECSWHALEDASCDPARFDGSVGVFGGCAVSTYWSSNLRPAGAEETLGVMTVGLANDKDSLTLRVAHTLGLAGPAYGVQSYCSTSLVAVCAAATSLANLECDLALAGGVAIAVPDRTGYVYQPGGIASPDGECRAFDASGQGSLIGNGVGVVALRRLEDALADGDRVYAVIRGWAVNNDAGRKVGFTAPGVSGQAAVVAEALGSAGLDPADIDYVEAHGTGTALGDAAELAALQQVFAGQEVLIGSVKTNLGHLDRAAGVTGLIKAALSLHHSEIPATLNHRSPNPQMESGEARLTVVTERTPWQRGERVRRAGVSAFGIGGTNAHVVLEEAPPVPAGADDAAHDSTPEVLVWSARTPAAADEATARLAAHLSGGSAPLAGTAFTLQTGRRVFEHRRALVTSDRAAAATALAADEVLGRTDSTADRPVAFLIAGTGEHYEGMAAELYATRPVFRAALDECRAVLAEVAGGDLLAEMLRPRRSPGGDGDLARLLGRGDAVGGGTGDATDRLQPALFAVEYALARLFQSWGITPSVMVGYSLGEYVAAALSGVLTAADAVRLVAHRARLIHALPPGAMAAVPLPVDEVRFRIGSARIAGLDVAALNGPEITVVSGTPEAMAAFEDVLRRRSVPCRRLATTHAFHSHMLQPARAELTAWIERNVRLHAPAIPYVSNVTGTLITPQQAQDPGYWAEHMCAPVHFDEALATLLAQGEHALLEVGPGQSLTAMARGHRDCARERWALIGAGLPGSADPRSAEEVLAETVARLWLAGVPVDWRAYREPREGRRTGAPGYPFQRERHWIDAPATAAAPALPAAPVSVPGVPAPVAGAAVELTVQQWIAEDIPVSGAAPTGTFTLVADSGGVAGALAGLLRAEGCAVRVTTADEFAAASADESAPAATTAVDGATATVVHLASLDRSGHADDEVPAVLSAARTAAACGESGTDVRLVVATRGGQAVAEGERPAPAQAAVAALAVVAGQEYLNLAAAHVDLDPAQGPEAAARALAAELRRDLDSAVSTAYRGGRRFVPAYASAEDSGQPTPPVRSGGTYLLTGGMSDVGLTLAGHLARSGAARLVLAGRSGAPDDPGSPRGTALARLRGLGAEVVTPALDVTDRDALAALFAEHRIDGVVHLAADTSESTFVPLRDVDEAVLRRQFAAKVGGARTLAAVLGSLPADRAPRWCAVFSSTSALLGGIAFGGYAAANAALTAVALGAGPAGSSVLPTPGDTRRAAHGNAGAASDGGTSPAKDGGANTAVGAGAGLAAVGGTLPAEGGGPGAPARGNTDAAAAIGAYPAENGELPAVARDAGPAAVRGTPSAEGGGAGAAAKAGVSPGDGTGTSAAADHDAGAAAHRGNAGTAAAKAGVSPGDGVGTSAAADHDAGAAAHRGTAGTAAAIGAGPAEGGGLPAAAIDSYPAATGCTVWTSAAWDTWAATVRRLDGRLGASMAAHSMADDDALAAFDRAVGGPRPSVVVVAGGLLDRLPGAAAPAGGGTASGSQPRPDLPQRYVPPVTATQRLLAGLWTEVLGVEPVGIRDNFFDLGGTSLLGLQMLANLKKRAGIVLPSVALFEAPTVQALARTVDERTAAAGVAGTPAVVPGTAVAQQPALAAVTAAPVVHRTARPAGADPGQDRRIAIVGMAGRFPGAGDVAAFWRNLCDGVESVRFFSEQELLDAGVPAELVHDPAYVPARPVLDDVTGFDAAFFGMSPRMAALTDPQQRLFLEVCWEALEQSGYCVPEHRGRVGVYGGANISTYLLGLGDQVLADGDISAYEIIMGNDKDALTTTVSYLFDLHGPSVAVQTFCSTSLVATHLAVQSLRAGECELALAGGVSVRVPDRVGHVYTAGGQESPDGHVRAFDAQARGSMFGDGAAVVVLKRLSDALRDGDHVWGVIRGTAMNNDGALKAGYTAPSVVGQSLVVADAMADAGVSAEDIGYVEAHGTGTVLGDPIEVAALTRAFGPTELRQFCPIGSVKPNVGHLDRAAGVTGLIKTALTLKEKVIPPTLHYTAPNPEIDFAGSPFYVNDRLSPWPAPEGRLRTAGLNSLGMGGTNVHVVVEEPPDRPARPAADPVTSRRYHLLPVSGGSATAADQACALLAGHLRERPDEQLSDVAFTLQVGRRTFEHRRVAVAASTAEAAALLGGGTDAQGLLSRIEAARGRPAAFHFGPREGECPTGFGELYRREPVFQAALDDLIDALGETLADAADRTHLASLLTADVRALVCGSGAPAAHGPAAARVLWTVVDLALAATLAAWGVRPASVSGEGAGRITAACAGGRMTARDALALAVRPGPGEGSGYGDGSGRGDAVGLPAGAPADVASAADADLPAGVTPGDTDALAGVRSTADADVLASVAPVPDPDAAVVLFGAPPAGAAVPAAAVLPGLSGQLPCDAVLTAALAGLWLAGADVDWPAYHGRSAGLAPEDPAAPGRIPLPTYPFQRQRYWIDREPRTSAADRPGSAPEPTCLTDIDDLPLLPEEEWLSQPVWRQIAAAAPAPDQPASWLVFAGGGAGEDVLTGLRAAAADSGATVTAVRPGPGFEPHPEGYAIRPGSVEDAVALLTALDEAGTRLDRVVHLWNLGVEPGDERAALTHGTHTLVALARAAGALGLGGWQLDIVAPGAHAVLGGAEARPDAATLVGPALVVPLEYPTVTTRLIDVETATRPADVVAELRRERTEPVVALRGARRYVRGFEILPAAAPEQAAAVLRENGVYLITGGLGGIGLAMAARLARDVRARLVLLGRTGLPPRESWPAIAAGAEPADEVTRDRVRQVLELTALGAQVEVVAGDVAEPDDVRRAVELARERFGALHGVLHTAGVPGVGLIQFKQPEDCDVVLAPKADGVRALAAALRLGEGEPDGEGAGDGDAAALDFVALFSSITSVTGGGPGQVDYCAANAYLDAQAARLAAAGLPVLSICWGEWTWNAWQEGLAGYDDGLQAFFRQHRARFGIGFEEGWRTLLRALAAGEPGVVVSTQDLPTIARFSALFNIDTVTAPAAGAAQGPRYPRPELLTPYREPQDPAQQRIAAAWCDTLKLERVGVDDNFFELGGNSLLGIPLLADLRSAYPAAKLPPHILYEAPTVAALARIVDGPVAVGAPAGQEGAGDGVRAQARLRRSGVQAAAARRKRV